MCGTKRAIVEVRAKYTTDVLLEKSSMHGIYGT